MYLNSINFTPITHIKWMHHEQKDDSLKHCLTSVTKYECYNNNLRAYEEEKFGGGNS